jgi:hypothetical protein
MWFAPTQIEFPYLPPSAATVRSTCATAPVPSLRRSPVVAVRGGGARPAARAGQTPWRISAPRATAV